MYDSFNRLVICALVGAMMLLCLLSLIGCKATGTENLGGAGAYIDAAKAHADAEGKGLLTKAEQKLTEDRKARYAEHEACEKTRTQLAIQDTWWVGARTKRYALAVSIIAGGLWLILGLIGAFLPAGGIGSTILRLLPWANPFAVIRDRMVNPPTGAT